MNEHPILFSTPLVLALLAGRKTQTRRIIKPQPDSVYKSFLGCDGIWRFSREAIISPVSHPDNDRRCPYGKPGDLLFVRESWQLHDWDFEDGNATFNYAAGDSEYVNMPEETGAYLAAQDWLDKQVMSLVDKGYYAPQRMVESPLVRTKKPYPFKPSIHMPKWAARIWLQVEDVRVERLQDISEEDAKAEGIETATEASKRYRGPQPKLYRDYTADITMSDRFIEDPIESFTTLWIKINGFDSWEANPWLWVVKFKVLSTTGRPAKAEQEAAALTGCCFMPGHASPIKISSQNE